MGLRDTEEQLDACREQSQRDERQIAELEHDLARAESALADRLRHDAHAHPTAHTIDRVQLVEILSLVVDTSTYLVDELADQVLALVQPADGILITHEEAALAIRAARHSAESIRAVLDVDPNRLHPDVAPYVDRLTDLADRLQESIR